MTHSTPPSPSVCSAVPVRRRGGGEEEEAQEEASLQRCHHQGEKTPPLLFVCVAKIKIHLVIIVINEVDYPRTAISSTLCVLSHRRPPVTCHSSFFSVPTSSSILSSCPTTSFSSAAGPFFQQPNIKQKFVALLKRFKVTDEVRGVCCAVRCSVLLSVVCFVLFFALIFSKVNTY